MNCSRTQVWLCADGQYGDKVDEMRGLGVWASSFRVSDSRNMCTCMIYWCIVYDFVRLPLLHCLHRLMNGFISPTQEYLHPFLRR